MDQSRRTRLPAWLRWGGVVIGSLALVAALAFYGNGFPLWFSLLVGALPAAGLYATWCVIAYAANGHLLTALAVVFGGLAVATYLVAASPLPEGGRDGADGACAQRFSEQWPEVVESESRHTEQVGVPSESRISWWPSGIECTWTLHDRTTTMTSKPGWRPTVIAAALASASAAAALGAARANRRTTG